MSDGVFSQFGPEAGGYVTGLNVADNGTMYIRTDVGGCYRKPPGTGGSWTQMMTVQSYPQINGAETNSDAIACSPTNPDVVYSVGGRGFDPAGRVLRSVNGGTTWTWRGSGTAPETGAFQVEGNAERRPGRVNMAVQHDSTEICYYGSRRQGLWRTINGGTTWTKLSSLPDQTITWTDRVGASLIIIERGSPVVGGLRQNLWASVHGKNIWRSTDAGATWTSLYALAASAYVIDGQLDSNGNLVACIHNPEGANFVVRITPAGSVTTFGLPSGGYGSVAVHPTDPNYLIVADIGGADNRFWRSTNGGTSWQTLTIRITNGTDGAVWPTQSTLDQYMSTGHIRFDPANPANLWYAEGMGMWRCSNHGAAELVWDFASLGIQELVANAGHKPPGTGFVAVCWDRGVFKWNAQNKATLPFTAQQGRFCSAWDVQAQPDNLQVMAATISQHQGATDENPSNGRLSAISTDGGTTWTRLAGLANNTAPLGLRFGTIAIARGDTDNLVWAPSTGYNANDLAIPLRYSRDRGATWLTPSIPGLSNEDVSRDKYLKQRKLIASQVTNGKFYILTSERTNGTHRLGVSTDGGATWTLSAISIQGHYLFFNASIVAVPFGSTEYLYLCPGPSGNAAQEMDAGVQKAVYRSTDGGVTWGTIALSQGNSMAFGAPIAPSTDRTLYGYGYVGTTMGLYRSTDRGTSWQFITRAPLGWQQQASALAGDPEVAGKVYYGMGGGSFFVGQSS